MQNLERAGRLFAIGALIVLVVAIFHATLN